MKRRFGLPGICISFLLAITVEVRGQDIILEWNEIALQVNVLDHNGVDTPGDQLSDTQGPPASARVLALVHAAMFDAYNSIDPQFEPYQTSIRFSRGASIDVAVAQAAHDTIVGLFPGNQAPRPQIRRLVGRKMFRTILMSNGSVVSKARGVVVGKMVAKRLLKSRQGDAAFLGGTYLSTGLPGDHDVDPKNPLQSFISPDIGGLQPFGVDSVLPYRAPAPPTIDSVSYAEAFEEVKELGKFRGGEAGDPVLTNDETYVVANYWSYNGSPKTGTPPRLYNQIVRQIAIAAGNDVAENARLFALVNIAMGDAGVSAWDSKYTYRYWRPVLGIQRADEDGNPLTIADPDWCALGGSRSNPFPGEQNFTPPFPAYTSGHATFGAAALKVAANFYQGDTIPGIISPTTPFAFLSDEWNGETKDQFNRVRPIVIREFDSLNCLVSENAASRVFNGVHWRYDGTEGVRAGFGIANEIFDSLLRPMDGGGDSSIADPDFETKIDDILRNTSTGQ